MKGGSHGRNSRRVCRSRHGALNLDSLGHLRWPGTPATRWGGPARNRPSGRACRVALRHRAHPLRTPEGGADKRLATILGAAGGALAFPIAVFVRDLPVSHWGAVNWMIVLSMCGYLGARAGGLVWSVADMGEETGEPSAPDQALIRGPDILDEASVRADAARDHAPLPRRGGHSRDED
jgi:hypothetical protein